MLKSLRYVSRKPTGTADDTDLRKMLRKIKDEQPEKFLTMLHKAETEYRRGVVRSHAARVGVGRVGRPPREVVPAVVVPVPVAVSVPSPVPAPVPDEVVEKCLGAIDELLKAKGWEV